jgi:hypothetical protein
MSNKIKAYLVCTAILGAAVFAKAGWGWGSANPLHFLIYLLLAVWAGSLKVRLPGMSGTYSLNFIFVLIGIVDMSFSETVAIATASMIMQCCWRAKRPPRWEQVLFNANGVAVSAALAYLTAQRTPVPGPVQVALAAAVYYLVNTALVSGVLGMVEEKPFLYVWSRWFKWSFSYYAMGVCLVAAIIFFNHRFGWPYALVFLPFMYLEYFHLRSDLEYHDLSTAC